MRVALLIDVPPTVSYHRATVDALGHAADGLGRALDLRMLTTDAAGEVFDADGIVVGPGSPYRDEQSVWDIVRTARERGVPLVGT